MPDTAAAIPEDRRAEGRDGAAGSTLWRSFRTAAWLGWQIESNWTRPLMFATYAVAKPLALAGILVVMYATVTRSDFTSAVFSYMYLGNAFYMYVGAVMTGMAWAVIDDRERYRMLKVVYVAPIDVRIYLIGRGVARFLTASVSVIITIIVGVLFLHVRIDPLAVNWPLFAISLAVGVVMLAMMGLLLSGLMLVMAHGSWAVGEGVAGAMYLFTGAIFPLEVLPASLRPVGFLLPVTYWLELLRRLLVGSVAQAFPTLSGIGNLTLLGILIALTLAVGVVAIGTFAWCDHRARERGMIDWTTNY